METKINNRLYEVNQAAAEFYHSYLFSKQGETALAHLKDGNLTLDTIEVFGIGAAPDECDGLIQHLTEKGFSITEITGSDLAIQSKDGQFSDRFRAGLVFPIADEEGNVIAFSSRSFSNNSSVPIFLNTINTSIYDKGKSLFGLNIAKKYGTEQIVLVEGIFDVISLYQAGIRNVVAVQSVNFTECQAALLSKYTKKVIVCFDSDLPGQKGTERTATILNNSNIPAAFITLDDGMDPYSFVSKYGGEKFKEKMLLASNEPPINTEPVVTFEEFEKG